MDDVVRVQYAMTVRGKARAVVGLPFRYTNSHLTLYIN